MHAARPLRSLAPEPPGSPVELAVLRGTTPVRPLLLLIVLLMGVLVLVLQAPAHGELAGCAAGRGAHASGQTEILGRAATCCTPLRDVQDGAAVSSSSILLLLQVRARTCARMRIQERITFPACLCCNRLCKHTPGCVRTRSAPIPPAC